MKNIPGKIKQKVRKLWVVFCFGLRYKKRAFFTMLFTKGPFYILQKIRRMGAAMSNSAAANNETPVPAYRWEKPEQYMYFSHYEDDKDYSDLKTDIKALAFYLPQFHTFPENDQWWGKGFTEWTNTRKAVPAFPGHYQPREPHADIGYYDLSDYRVMARQAEMAKKHGIYGFCFYHYWFSGKRLMEKPVDLLLEHPEIDLNFCLCWANENWTRTWDGMENNVLISQQHIDDDIQYIIDLKKYIDDPRYIRIDGKPVVLIYRPAQLPDVTLTFKRWREWCRNNGVGEILIWIVRGCANDEKSCFFEGADAEVEFPPSHCVPWSPVPEDCGNPHGSFVSDYSAYVDRILAGEGCVESYKHPVYRGVMMGWDCAARRKNFFCWGKYSIAKYSQWLRYVIDYTRKHHDANDRFIFINAWNEWAEGTYLEPDRRFGYTSLNTTSRALFDLPQIEMDKETVCKKILERGFFDYKWYIETYPELNWMTEDFAFEHFMNAGWREGRQPSAKFPYAAYKMSRENLLQDSDNPLVDFICSGSSDSVLDEVIADFDRKHLEGMKKLKIQKSFLKDIKVPEKVADCSLGVHLHLYYEDMLPKIIEYLQNIPVAFLLYISTVKDSKTNAEIQKTCMGALKNLKKCRVKTVPNRGRDVAPMLCSFKKELLSHDFICHLHTKKSLYASTHAVWADFIYERLMGSEETVRKILGLLSGGGTGIVYPANFLSLVEMPYGWGSNIECCRKLLDRCKVDIDLRKELPVIEFPQGTMFWAKSKNIKKLFDLSLKYDDFPEEPIGTDGTIAHAIERLLLILNMYEDGNAVQIFKDDDEKFYNMKRYIFEK